MMANVNIQYSRIIGNIMKEWREPEYKPVKQPKPSGFWLFGHYQEQGV
jgi:hypothetical protein